MNEVLQMEVTPPQLGQSKSSGGIGDVSIFAVLSGALIGVAAIAAAPFTGGGSILAAGVGLGASLSGAGAVAVAAGAVGAIGGAALSANDTAEAKRKGYEHGIAESAVKIKDLSNALVGALAALSSQRQRDEFLAKFFKIGYAIAACDGRICEEERQDLKALILGAGRHVLSAELKEMIAAIEASPPSLYEAIAIAGQLDRSLWVEIDALMQIVAEANGEISAEERAFIDMWNVFKADRTERAIA